MKRFDLLTVDMRVGGFPCRRNGLCVLLAGVKPKKRMLRGVNTREGQAVFCNSVGRHVYPAFAVAFSTAWSVDSFTRLGLLNNRQ